MKAFLFGLILVTFSTSCRKQHSTDGSLIGKWKLVSVYSGYGYAMGGCFCWTDVAPINAQTLEFKKDGRYSFTEPPVSSVSSCSGKYRVLNDSTIAMTSNCQSDPDKEINYYYTKTVNIFTIDYRGIEGVIRHKYVKQ